MPVEPVRRTSPGRTLNICQYPRSTGDDKICGRPLSERTEDFRCYFHSSEEKDTAEFAARMQELLSEHPHTIDCSGFVFPEFHFPENHEIQGDALFVRSLFRGKLNLSGLVVRGMLNLRECNFESSVTLNNATIHGKTRLSSSIFKSTLHLKKANLMGGLDAPSVVFSTVHAEEAKIAGFNATNSSFNRFVAGKMRVEGEANFGSAQFLGTANFENAKLRGTTNFWHAKFSETAHFRGTSFEGPANFGHIKTPYANFFHTKFAGMAFFHKAIFDGVADFEQAVFGSPSIFQDSIFDKARFLETEFQKGASFVGAEFSGICLFKKCHAGDPLTFVAARITGELVMEDLVSSAGFRAMKRFDADRLSQGHDAPEPSNSNIPMTRHPAPISIDFSEVFIANNGKVTFQGLRDHISGSAYHFNIGTVRFAHTDLGRVQFKNIVWQQKPAWRTHLGARFWRHRMISRIADECYLHRVPGKRTFAMPETNDRLSAEHVADLYKGLRLAHEKTLRYGEAGIFHVREMEMRRIKGRFGVNRQVSVLSMYRMLSLYGESYSLSALWMTCWFFLIFAYYDGWLSAFPGVPFSISTTTAGALAKGLGGFVVTEPSGLGALVARLIGAILATLLILALRRNFRR